MDKDIDEPGDRDELDEHDELDELDDASEPWPPAGYPPPRNATRRGRRVAALAATAVLAAGGGFAVVTAALRDGTASPAANASPGANQPGGTAPSGAAPSGGAGNQLQPGSGALPTPGPGQGLRLAIGGKVAAVSATSITLGSPGRYVTAAVTGATKITGKVSDISGVKVGDMVTAQITGTGGKLTAIAIQDPASLP
jgi:hypothetical protein